MRLAVYFFLLVVFVPSARADEPLPKELAPYFTPPAELAKDFGKYRRPLLFDDGTMVKDAGAR